MNILYIANPHSVHDIKWMEYFSAKPGHKVYVMAEARDTGADVKAVEEKLAAKNMVFAGTLNSFSIKNILAFNYSVGALQGVIAKHKIDIVHILFATPYAMWGNYSSVSYIITTRGSDALLVLPGLKKEKGLRGLYFYWLFSKFSKAFRGAAGITCTSVRQADAVRGLFGSSFNPQIIRTGVDVERINAIDNFDDIDASVRDKSFVLFPRNIMPIYNTLLQIEAINLLDDETLKGYSFVFVRGRNYDKAYLQQVVNRLKDLKTQRGLHYLILDELTQAQIWQYFKKAKLCVMTPVSDGTPNTALEAMAAKCPLILPNLDYDAELFGDVCVKLRTYEPKELADEMKKALVNYPQQYIETGYKKALSLGNRQIEMQKLETLYQSITKK